MYIVYPKNAVFKCQVMTVPLSSPYNATKKALTATKEKSAKARYPCGHHIKEKPNHRQPPPTPRDSFLACLLHQQYRYHTYIYNQRHSPFRNPKIQSNRLPLSSSSRPMSLSPGTSLVAVDERVHSPDNVVLLYGGNQSLGSSGCLWG